MTRALTVPSLPPVNAKEAPIIPSKQLAADSETTEPQELPKRVDIVVVVTPPTASDRARMRQRPDFSPNQTVRAKEPTPGDPSQQQQPQVAAVVNEDAPLSREGEMIPNGNGLDQPPPENQNQAKDGEKEEEVQHGGEAQTQEGPSGRRCGATSVPCFGRF